MPKETHEVGAPGQEAAGSHEGLQKQIRDHLGELLRAQYNRLADKPAYLGDDIPLPPEFEHKLLEIQKSEEIREIGVEAVGEALGLTDRAADADVVLPGTDTQRQK